LPQQLALAISWKEAEELEENGIELLEEDVAEGKPCISKLLDSH